MARLGKVPLGIFHFVSVLYLECSLLQQANKDDERSNQPIRTQHVQIQQSSTAQNRHAFRFFVQDQLEERVGFLFDVMVFFICTLLNA